VEAIEIRVGCAREGRGDCKREAERKIKDAAPKGYAWRFVGTRLILEGSEAPPAGPVAHDVGSPTPHHSLPALFRVVISFASWPDLARPVSSSIGGNLAVGSPFRRKDLSHNCPLQPTTLRLIREAGSPSWWAEQGSTASAEMTSSPRVNATKTFLGSSPPKIARGPTCTRIELAGFLDEASGPCVLRHCVTALRGWALCCWLRLAVTLGLLTNFRIEMGPGRNERERGTVIEIAGRAHHR
jgi:hypothetical protein